MRKLISSAYYHIKQPGKYAPNYWLCFSIRYTAKGMSVMQLWMCCYICNRYKTQEMWFMKYISAWTVQKIPNCLHLFIISPVKLKRALCHPSLPYLACASAGIISFRITEMPATQHAMLPSFPALIHQATQIFSPNPPFACTPIPLEFDNTIWRADWIPPPSNIIGLLVSCLQGSNKMSCFPFGPLMPLWASFCRSLMCHSEITALVSNLLVDLEIMGQQQVSLLSPVRHQ